MNNELQQNLDAILLDKNTNLKPENLKSGVTCLGVTGTYEGITPDITIPSDDYGLETATSGELDNDVGIKLFTNANTQSKLYENNSIIEMHATNELIADTINLTADKLKSGESILGIEGSVIELKGQEKTINPTTQEQIITSDINYNAITKLTINPVTSSIDSNIVAENIKNGVTVLGVTGTYTEGVITEGSSPIFNNEIIMMDIPYTNLNRNADINTVMFGDFNSLTSLELDEDAWLPDEMHGQQSNPDYVSPLIHVAGILTNEINNATIILYYCAIQSRNHWSNSANNSNYIYLDLYNSSNDLICSLNTNINKSFQKMNTMRDSNYFIGVTYNLSAGIVEQIFTQFDHAQLRAVPIE